MSAITINDPGRFVQFDGRRLIFKYKIFELTVLASEIKGLERTSACFFIKTKKNEDIWLKF